MMLSALGAGIADDVLRRPLTADRWAVQARAVAEVACELGDRVAWAVILGDRTVVEWDEKDRPRLRLAPVLEAFHVVHGNRKGTRRQRT